MSKEMTPAEAATIKRLRTQGGWYNGDIAALEALRDFSAAERAAERVKARAEWSDRIRSEREGD
jgi:hypothetical protein